MPSEREIDAQQLAKNLGLDDPDLMEDVWDIVNTYVEDVRMRLGFIEQAIAAEDHDKVRQEAHTLKGSSGSICASRMQALASALEQEAKQQASARYAELLNQLKDAFECVKADIVRQKIT